MPRMTISSAAFSWAFALLLAFIALAIPGLAGASTFLPFPDTGQSKCYNAISEIFCPQPGQPFYGQDAQYQPRLPRAYAKLGRGGVILADNARHVDEGGPWLMTRDTVTGLIWELKTAANKGDTHTWQEARDVFLTGLNSAGLGGFSDWRLPSVTELSSLVNGSLPWPGPVLDQIWFPNAAAAWYWSATPLAVNTNAAWLVNFSYGGVNTLSKTGTYSVRAVRSGQPGPRSFDDLVVHGDGTFSDPTTGLMWQLETAPGTHTWENALQYAENLRLAGFSDWKLPNRNELQSLLHYGRFRPAVASPIESYVEEDQTTFASWYWSSTTSAESTNFAWLVNYGNGQVHGGDKSRSYFVRAVRLGQSDIGSFGSVSVAVSPAAAVAEGARWRRVGEGTWREGGATESSVPVGTYEVEFKDVDGWTTPANVRVDVVEGQTARAAGTYVQEQRSGSIRVTIEPRAARDAGAQWRRSGTVAWRDSGTTESDVPTGGQTVEFKPVPDWVTPGNAGVAVSVGQTATATGTYTPVQRTVTAVAGSGGSVTPDARTVDHGAAASFTVRPDAGHVPGSVGGTCPPGSFNADTYTTGAITADCTVSFSFTAQIGSLRVIIEPAAARDAGALWRRVGTSAWWESGVTEDNVPSGSRMVEFRAVDRWTSPGPVGVTVISRQTAEAEGLYLRGDHTVAPFAGENGRISPAAPHSVAHADVATFTLTPSPGYTAIVGGTCGGSLTGSVYVTEPVVADCTVMATFSIQANRPPEVRIRDAEIYPRNMGEIVVLDASDSVDPDGDPLFFSWREAPDNPRHGLLPLGSEVRSRLHLSFPAPGRYQFAVRVSDGVMMSAETRTMTVYVPGITGLIGFLSSDALVRVADAAVRVHATEEDARNNANPVDLAVSDSLGRYLLESVAPQDQTTGRTYHARVERPGFQSTRILTLSVQPDPGDGSREDMAIGQGQVSTMSGFVRTPEGAPIPGALVSIMPGLGSQTHASTTDGNGFFRLSGVPKGSWSMQLRADGFRPEVRDVTVADGMADLLYTMQAASGTGTLRGTVRPGGTDNPAANARVALGTGAEAFADSQGRYVFADIPVGEYILTVTRNGYEPQRLVPVRVGTGDTVQDLRLSFVSRGVLVSGTITDAVSGLPVRRAGVGVETLAGLPGQVGVTDVTGFYQLRDVPAGVRRLRITAPGYAPKTVDETFVRGRTMNIALERGPDWAAPVVPGQGRPEAVVEEEVIVLTSMNQSAWLDARPSGSNIEYLWRENPGNPVPGLLPSGTEHLARIEVSGFGRPGIYTFELQVLHDDLLSANTATVTVLVPGLSGNVHASPTDGITGLGAATVRAYATYADAVAWNDNHADSSRTHDGSGGNFVLRNLSPGARWIVARADAGAGFNQYGPVRRQVGAAMTARQARINMPRDEFSLSGTITDAATNAPLENVRVVAAPGSLSETYRTATDAQGRYRLSSVPRGAGQPILVLREGYTTRVVNVDISGDMTRDVALTPNPGAEMTTLSGRVAADYQGLLLPVSDAEVIIGSGLARTWTDADGFYEIANLPPGRHHGVIRKPGYVPRGLGDNGFVTLAPGANTINMHLAFAGSGPVIRGIVVTTRQEPLPGVTIGTRQPAGPFGDWARSPAGAGMQAEFAAERGRNALPQVASPLRSDAAGIFQMVDLPHGRRSIEARLPDGRMAIRMVQVDGNMELVFTETEFLHRHDLTYTAGPGGRIEGWTTQHVIPGQDGEPVTALPDPGYHFTGWSDGRTEARRQDTNVTTNLTVTAGFAPNPEIAVHPGVPDGGGRVEGGGSHSIGALVAFRAIADPGYIFSHWTLNGRTVTGAGATHTFPISDGMVLTAHFTRTRLGLPGVLMLLLE